MIDAGALQMMDVALIPLGAILTPHHGEFETLFQKDHSGRNIFDPLLLGLASLVQGKRLRQNKPSGWPGRRSGKRSKNISIPRFYSRSILTTELNPSAGGGRFLWLTARY